MSLLLTTKNVRLLKGSYSKNNQWSSSEEVLESSLPAHHQQSHFTTTVEKPHLHKLDVLHDKTNPTTFGSVNNIKTNSPEAVSCSFTRRMAASNRIVDNAKIISKNASIFLLLATGTPSAVGSTESTMMSSSSTVEDHTSYEYSYEELSYYSTESPTVNETGAFNENSSSPYLMPWPQRSAWIVVFTLMLLVAIAGNTLVAWIVLGNKSLANLSLRI